jgi:hypothetical protein
MFGKERSVAAAGQVEGFVEPGFDKVADTFADNFTNPGDTGAACAFAGSTPWLSTRAAVRCGQLVRPGRAGPLADFGA